MAKKSSKKTEDKELKPVKVKKEEIVFPDTPFVNIKLNKDGKIYSVRNLNARAIINAGRGVLV